MKIISLLLSVLLLTACADVQDSMFEVGVTAERGMSGLEKKQITAAGHDWIYLDSDPEGKSGKPVVLMLHGFAVDKDNWIRFARDFDEYRVIVPDLPGHGETSYNPELTYDFETQAVWLEDFVTKLGLKQFHLMGNSMGGGISALYAYAHPDQVLTLTLVDAAGVYPPKASALQEILDNPNFKVTDNPLIVRSREDFDRLRNFAMEDQPFLPWPAPAVLARQSIKRAHINEKIFADIHAVAEAAKTSDEHLKKLEALDLPVFILWGKEDRALDVSSVAIFEKHIKGAKSKIMPGVGHAPMVERPSESAEYVLEFIKNS